MSIQSNQTVKAPTSPVAYAGAAVKSVTKGTVQASAGLTGAMAKAGLVIGAILIADSYLHMSGHSPLKNLCGHHVPVSMILTGPKSVYCPNLGQIQGAATAQLLLSAALAGASAVSLSISRKVSQLAL